MFRRFSLIDRLTVEVDHFIRSVYVPARHANRPSPAETVSDCVFDDEKKNHVAGLMRVDHTGEICAQALYRGQAVVAKTQLTKTQLQQAAEEEYDHLSWCQQRLDELSASTSRLNPFWYLASFTIGATAGMISDKLSYGFVVETERQVMRHLDKHLSELPENDEKSRVILTQMYKDEAEHAVNAKLAGGVELPFVIRLMMKAQSKVMTTVAYRM
ncbi:MAG: 2-polyprenyl-3-methyl-6-methoxy-1,4-benzoquinone monooxygenase [Francisellaceae bacterium]